MQSFLEDIFLAALEQNKPAGLLETFFREHPENWPESQSPFYVMAAGKAAGPMAAWLAGRFHVAPGNVIAVVPESSEGSASYLMKASHPVPDEQSIRAGRSLAEFARAVPAGATVYFALSGGTSSLVCGPASGITLAEMQQVQQGLLKSGATIQEMNGVRKHVSQIKGGQLLRHFHPDVQLIDLVISDVPHDDLSVIGSGLTIADPTTFADAIATLKKYGLWERAANGVRNHLEEGKTGTIPETVKPGDDPIENHSSFIIGSASRFARTIGEEMEKKGIEAVVADGPYTESVEKVADFIFSRIKEARERAGKPVALIFYGESTVQVTGDGKGGRNQELALRGALKIAGMDKVSWLSAGTDGVDGPTDAAGAIVNGSTISKAQGRGLEAEDFLQANDSYHFHRQMDTLLVTGPTGNNVMDVTVVFVE